MFQPRNFSRRIKGKSNAPLAVPFLAYTNHYLDRVGSKDAVDSDVIAGYVGGSAYSVNTNLSNVHSGTTSLQVTDSSENFQSVRFDALPFTAPLGATVSVTCWVKCNSTTRYAFGIEGDHSGSVSYVYGDNTWNQVTYNATAGSTDTPTRLTFIARGDSGQGNADVYFDDIEATITGITAPTSFTDYFGGRANAYGYFHWPFENVDINITNNATENSGYVSSQEFDHSHHYATNGISKVSNEIRFLLVAQDGNEVGEAEDGNYRQEYAEAEWDSRKVLGTQEFVGFTYRFGSGYIPDTACEWLFWQNKTIDSGVSSSPAMEIVVASTGLYGATGGEIIVKHDAGNTSNRTLTGIIPVANQTLNIVLEMIHDEVVNGLFKVWINDVLVHNVQDRTVYTDRLWGGNNKFGIYKFPWKNQVDIDASDALGITQLETFLGQLRIYRLRPGSHITSEQGINIVKPR